MSTFDTLKKIDITKETREKGQFDYLSWSNAVRFMLSEYPTATWKYTTWQRLPYLKTELGYFVECTVKIEKISRTQMMVVMNHKNQTNFEPKATDINKAQQRALVKAIALHGLGLELWAGEDLTDDEGSQLVSPVSYNLLKNKIESIGINGTALVDMLGVAEMTPEDFENGNMSNYACGRLNALLSRRDVMAPIIDQVMDGNNKEAARLYDELTEAQLDIGYKWIGVKKGNVTKQDFDQAIREGQEQLLNDRE